LGGSKLPAYLARSTLGPLFLVLRRALAAPEHHQNALGLLQYLGALLAPVIGAEAGEPPSLASTRASRRAGWLLELLSVEGVTALADALEAGPRSPLVDALRGAAQAVIDAACAEEVTISACAGWTRAFEREGGVAVPGEPPTTASGTSALTAEVRAARAAGRGGVRAAGLLLERLWAMGGVEEKDVGPASPLPVCGGGDGGGGGGGPARAPIPPAHKLALLFAASTAPLSDLLALWGAPARVGGAALGPHWLHHVSKTYGATTQHDDHIPYELLPSQRHTAALFAPHLRGSAVVAISERQEPFLRGPPWPSFVGGGFPGERAPADMRAAQQSAYRTEEEALAAAIAASLATAAPPAPPAAAEPAPEAAPLVPDRPTEAAANEAVRRLALLHPSAPSLLPRATMRARTALFGIVPRAFGAGKK
jgi:hypothetical protein